MKSADDKLTMLEQKHALRLLSSLYLNGKSKRSHLYNAISNTTTAPMNRVNDLIDIGLINETILESVPFAKHVELTEKGRRVAAHVVEIEKILNGKA